jgi:hypothetical protein
MVVYLPWKNSRQEKSFLSREKKMKKGIVTAVVALSFMVCTAASSFACTGTVKAVDGTKVTVTCEDGKDTVAEGAAKVGDKVTVTDGKIAAGKKKAAIEGC